MKQLLLVLLVVLFAACNDSSKYSKIQEKKVEQTVTEGMKVTEVLDAGGYTYVKGIKDGEELWIAIPQTSIEVGTTVYFQGGMEMRNFESKQLNRTFDKILFLEGVSTDKNAVKQVKEAPKAAKERPALPNLVLPEDVISVGDVYEKQQEFEGKSLTVYGVVWKVNNGILDRNWIHIEDGTSAGDKSSLTITSAEYFKVGDTIKLKGKLTLNKDFGYGYVYDVLLEEGEAIK